MSDMRAIAAAQVYNSGRFAPGLAVVIDGDRISAVAARSQLPTGLLVEDWGNVALVPGTVNAHGHAFQSLFKGFTDDRAGSAWRHQVLYPFTERLSGDEIHAAALFAFAEAARAGTTTTVDFFYLHDDGNDNAERVISAAKQVGIRLVLARTFYEPGMVAGAPARFGEDPVSAAERLHALAGRYAADPSISIQPAPHSLRAASLATVRRALEIAEELDVACHLHVHEGPGEREAIETRLGATPIRLLAREGLLTPRMLIIHGMNLDDDEIELIGRGGASVVHCPATSMFFGHSMTPTVAMMERGVRVALGFDGGCGNNRQSIFDEMRMASLSAKVRAGDPGAMGVDTAFAMGTSVGAQVLSVDAGRLEAGALADLVALDLNDLSLQPLQTLKYQVVHSMQQTAIRKVMVGGELIVDEGQLTRVSQDDIAARVSAIAGNWEMPARI